METSISDRLFCCPWVRRRVPVAYRDELYHVLMITLPVLITQILSYMPSFVNTMFCGRLGNNVMAGYGLACATINITTASTGYGLAVACDTLVSQTFGGKNLLRVGVILQRSILILLLFCLPCWALLINAQAILLCLGQDPEVARIAQLYITAFIPSVPAMYLQHLQVSYLQNQVIILPQMFTAVAANIANLITNYILVHWMELGISGSVAANALWRFYSCGFLFIYIRWKNLHAATWGGWSTEALQEWGSYMKLALASAVMKCSEWWIYECGGFLAGMQSGDELAAQHGLVMIAFITYMFPMGIQAAAYTRVGNALGAGNTSRAKLTMKVSFGLAVSFAIVQGAVLGSIKHVIGYSFTNDENIVSLISHMMNAYCFLQFFDGLVCVSTGIFVGTGKQKIPAVANIVGYYGIGLSMGLVLMFVAKLKTLDGGKRQFSPYLPELANKGSEKLREENVQRYNLDDLLATAFRVLLDRLYEMGVWSVESNPNCSVTNQTFLDECEHTMDHGEAEGPERPPSFDPFKIREPLFVPQWGNSRFWLGLLICVFLQSTFFVIIIVFKLDWKEITDEAVKRAHKMKSQSLLNKKMLLEKNCNDTVHTSGTENTVDGYNAPCPGSDEAVNRARVALSSTQLLLRRGLVALGAVAVLALGVSVHFLVPLPEPQSSLINATLELTNTTNSSTLQFPI